MNNGVAGCVTPIRTTTLDFELNLGIIAFNLRRSMSSDRSKSVLGDLELLVMLAVLRTGEEGYSRTIREDIRSRTGRSIARGALYVTLDRLTEKGLLRTWKGEPRSERGGKARRHYAVTPSGLQVVRESWTMLRNMSDGLEEVLSEA